MNGKAETIRKLAVAAVRIAPHNGSGAGQAVRRLLIFTTVALRADFR